MIAIILSILIQFRVLYLNLDEEFGSYMMFSVVNFAR